MACTGTTLAFISCLITYTVHSSEWCPVVGWFMYRELEWFYKHLVVPQFQVGLLSYRFFVEGLRNTIKHRKVGIVAGIRTTELLIKFGGFSEYLRL
jgi:hypothetical protein